MAGSNRTHIETLDPPQGSREPAWTRRRVTICMVRAWREGKRPSSRGSLSSARNALDWVAVHVPLTGDQDVEARHFLMLFLWSQAEGESFRDLCRRRKRSRSTAMRRVKWALDRIVEGLNCDASQPPP